MDEALPAKAIVIAARNVAAGSMAADPSVHIQGVIMSFDLIIKKRHCYSGKRIPGSRYRGERR